ncbi:sensor histidine kinase KdpD [Pseudoruegeria sp. HB172150]|uniref:sensor histidine kinase n=1 Tax=Pseudoruegeria sp. HB172150 TaxID=2721164 RepID=UPI0015560E8E|nr:ATP-binding protein [Pseudoruegeria sp. HB172150]
MTIFVMGLWSAQILFVLLDSAFKEARYHRLMKERAIETMAEQAEAIVAFPGATLPVRRSIPVTLRSRVWASEKSAFESLVVPRDPQLENWFRSVLMDKGIVVDELHAAYATDVETPASVEARARFAGPRELPTYTYIALQVSGATGWINGQIASYARPDPVTMHDILLNLLIFAMVGGAGVALITKQITSALVDLKQAAENFGRPNAEPVDPERGPVEFREAIVALNEAGERIAELLDQKNVMLGAISHELRTPLTSLRLRLEGLQDDEERHRAITTAEEMARILDEILELAREGNSQTAGARYDLSAMLVDVVADEQERGRDVSLTCHERLVAKIRPASMRRLLHNIIGNAAVYAGSARVSAWRIGEVIHIVVEDDGPGMTEQDLQTMFTPFQRGEASRNRSLGGAGLGLAIARAIARAHGGDISISNRDPHGLRAEISLPG